MNNRYEQYWHALWHPVPIRRAILASLILHLLIVLGVTQAAPRRTEPPRRVISSLQFVAPPSPEPPQKETQPEPPKPEPEPEPPKPDPPKPEPKPDPPKPKVAKQEPKPEPVKKPEPKPEPPKKPDPPKPKPEPKKKEPEPEQIKVAKNVPKPEVKPKAHSGAKIVNDKLPDVLDGWARLVQRKVYRVYTVPGGVRMTEDKNEALVAFTVDRNGNLLAKPKIIQHASDKSLGQSGLRAILAAAPLPPLPEQVSFSSIGRPCGGTVEAHAVR